MQDLNDTRSIWIKPELLGTVQTLKHDGKEVRYRLPAQINRQVTIRFKGYGRSRNGDTGDLLLCVKVDQGVDVESVLWLCESRAAAGTTLNLKAKRSPVQVRVPPGSRHNDVVRIHGAGDRTPFEWGLQLFGRPRGDLLVKLRLFPDTIQPTCDAVERMSADQLSVEGWIYRRIDFVLERMRLSHFQLERVAAQEIAMMFNEGGWRALANFLVARLRLGGVVSIAPSDSIAAPGICHRRIQKDSSGRVVTFHCRIGIHQKFLDNPFAVVAILTHELCHAIYARSLAPRPDYESKPGAELLEEERTVDLLVFMFQLGEFQMRVARERGLTLGYFDQPLFERMQAILSRKHQVWQGVKRP